MNIPRHIAIIMDGNRRFSRRLMMKPHMGHEWGAKKIEHILSWCRDYGIRELTLYTFSIQNFTRPKQEFDFLMDTFRKQYRKIKNDPRIYEHKIRINVIGRLWMFPGDIQDLMQDIMERTKDHDLYTINFAMAYGGREEVVDAIKKIAEMVKEGELDIDEINEETFSRNLYFDHEPDLIIRTGGEKRTSNFLIWQSHYSEWIFLEKMWPEFEKKDFEGCIAEYNRRKRRFGR